MLGKIIFKNVLFLSDRNKFIKIKGGLITRLVKPKNQLYQSDLDSFLFQANKAWWLAKEKTITISNMAKILTKT